MLNCSYKIVLMEVIKVNFSKGCPLPALTSKSRQKMGPKALVHTELISPRSAKMRGWEVLIKIMCLFSKILKFDDGNLLLSWLPTSCPNFMLRAFFFVELLAFQIQAVPDNHGQKVRRLFWNVIIFHTLISGLNKISYAPMPLAKYWGIFPCKTCQTWKDHVPYSSLGPPCPEQVPTPSSTLLPPFTPPPFFYLKEGHWHIFPYPPS